MTKPLQKEFQFFLSHKDDLVEKYAGKFVVIAGEIVLGAYDSELEAVRETSKTLRMGTFLVQKCEPGENSYSQTFHSRVHFDKSA